MLIDELNMRFYFDPNSKYTRDEILDRFEKKILNLENNISEYIKNKNSDHPIAYKDPKSARLSVEAMKKTVYYLRKFKETI